MSIFNKLFQPYKDPKMQTVYVHDVYCERCEEYSRDTSYSYFYKYRKPTLIITNDNRTISADDILQPQGSNSETIEGVKGEYHDSFPETGIRTREYILYISEKACPLKVKYTTGDGEGYSDSDYWSSERKEYWVLYERERK